MVALNTINVFNPHMWKVATILKGLYINRFYQFKNWTVVSVWIVTVAQNYGLILIKLNLWI